MLPLECLFEGRKFLEQFSGCFAFDILGDLAYGNLRRNRDKNVDMIFGNMPFDGRVANVKIFQKIIFKISQI